MSIFDEFDSKVDLGKINEQKEKTGTGNKEYDPVPSGEYIARINNMELGLNKDKTFPMFKVDFILVEGKTGEAEAFCKKHKKSHVFYNKKVYGTKNDGWMIKQVEQFLADIFPDDPVVFENYSKFGEDIADVFEDCSNFEFLIDYTASDYPDIKILDVFE